MISVSFKCRFFPISFQFFTYIRIIYFRRSSMMDKCAYQKCPCTILRVQMEKKPKNLFQLNLNRHANYSEWKKKSVLNFCYCIFLLRREKKTRICNMHTSTYGHINFDLIVETCVCAWTNLSNRNQTTWFPIVAVLTTNWTVVSQRLAKFARDRFNNSFQSYELFSLSFWGMEQI